MNITLTVVVAAIVILITALVVITIFGGGMGQVGSVADAEAQCRSSGTIACRSTGGLPVTWRVPSMKTEKGTESCEDVTGCSDCGCLGVDAGETAGGPNAPDIGTIDATKG